MLTYAAYHLFICSYETIAWARFHENHLQILEDINLAFGRINFP